MANYISPFFFKTLSQPLLCLFPLFFFPSFGVWWRCERRSKGDVCEGELIRVVEGEESPAASLGVALVSPSD